MRMMISIILLSAVSAGWALSSGTSSITGVQTYGSFETAGITIRVDGMDFDETATVEYKRSADPDYQNGHDFVRYDGNHMATSLFWLESNTTYDIRITLIDPDGVTGANPVVTNVSTRPDYSLPAPLRVITVSTQTELNTAAAAAQPGDEIRIAGGTYPDGIAVSDRTGSEGHPIVVTSQTGTRPLLQGDADGGVTIEHSAYWVLDNLEVHNEEGDGIRFRGCHSMVIRRCYVHDSRPGDYTNNVFICHGEESDPPYAGNYLIEHNVISDEVHDTVDENQGPGESNTNVAGQSYFGIHLDYQPGGFATIRGNTIYGTVDGIHPTGDEGESPVMGPDDPDVLDSWHDQNLDLYDNVIYDCKDDAIECDGHMVNGRIFRNRLGKCENAVSTAPFYPGPLFVVRNLIHGFHQGCFKQNTGVDGVTRKVHFYHNTVREKQRTSPQHCGSEYCLYRGEPSYQQSFVYLNNIFFGRGRVYNGDLYGSGQYHRYDTFDYNLIYSTRQTDPTYACKWVCEYDDYLNNTKYVDLASFRASVGQELHGLWGDPRLDTTLLSGYPAVSKLLDLKILAESPAIDHGLPIPGINDGFLGTAPDIGAFEYDSAIPKDDFIGTWDGQGVYYRNSDTGAWMKMASPATLITAGDLGGDGVDDLIGIWTTQGGVWVKSSTNGAWTKLSTTAEHIAAGDLNGDGRVDFLGTWDGQGVYYRNSMNGAWVKMASPATLITAGDLDGDGIDDLIGLWPTQEGVWVKYSKTGVWSKLSSTAKDIAAGDMNGDGRDDLLATWDGQGVYYRNSMNGTWVKMATPADQVTCGYLDGDAKADLIGIWPTQGGVWVKYSATGSWAKLSSSARDIAAGKMRAETGGSMSSQALFGPLGGYAQGPESLIQYQDISSEGPGGLHFAYQTEELLIPQEHKSEMMRIPGPGEPGFRCAEEKNLIPEESRE